MYKPVVIVGLSLVLVADPFQSQFLLWRVFPLQLIKLLSSVHNYVWAGQVRVLSLAAGLDTPPGLCPTSHTTNYLILILIASFSSSDESFGKISKEDNNDTYTWDQVADKSWGNRCINTDSMIAFVYVK